MNARLKLNWSLVGTPFAALVVASVAGPLDTLRKHAPQVRMHPLIEFVIILPLVSGYVYLVASHSHAGSLGSYPRWIHTRSGFAAALANDMGHQVLAALWLSLVVGAPSAVLWIVVGGATLHAAYILMLSASPNWFFSKIANLAVGKLAEREEVSSPWRRQVISVMRVILTWTDCGAHIVGLLAVVAVGLSCGLAAPVALGVLFGLFTAYGRSRGVPPPSFRAYSAILSIRRGSRAMPGPSRLR